MKKKDQILLENAYESMRPKYIDLPNGQGGVDISELPDKTALFSFVMARKNLKEPMMDLVNKGDMDGAFIWVRNLDNTYVISNDTQKNYLIDALREAIHAKHPSVQKDFDSLKQQSAQ
jgi:hypothetical protein